MGRNHDFDDNEQWAPVSDLMAVLMLIFMFISVVYISVAAETADEQQSNEQKFRTQEQKIKEQQEKIKKQGEKILAQNKQLQEQQSQEHADTFKAECDAIYYELKDEFSDDFRNWQAQLSTDLAIRFKEADALFGAGEANPSVQFKSILSDFFPRYMQKIKIYESDITEIRIEGHTSSEWETVSEANIAYMENMKLSQNRARAILQYVMFDLPNAAEYNLWARPLVTANGLSSSKWIPGEDGITEDADKSRRVEFRLLVKSCLKAE